MKTVIPTLAAAVLIAACAALAAWQFQRAGDKAALIDAHANAGPVALARVDAETPRFAPVAGRGRFLPEHQILLDNQVHAGRAGVHVYTPFARASDGRVFLVNRGWLPLGPTRNVLPRWETPSGTRELHGRLNDPPEVGMRLGEGMSTGGTWPRLITYFDTTPVRKAIEAPVDERVIQLDPGHPAGFEDRDWQPVNFGPDRHTAYAWQWIAIGLTIAVIWILLTLGRSKPA